MFYTDFFLNEDIVCLAKLCIVRCNRVEYTRDLLACK